MICRNCGSEVDDYAVVCSNCGTSIQNTYQQSIDEQSGRSYNQNFYQEYSRQPEQGVNGTDNQTYNQRAMQGDYQEYMQPMNQGYSKQMSQGFNQGYNQSIRQEFNQKYCQQAMQGDHQQMEQGYQQGFAQQPNQAFNQEILNTTYGRQNATFHFDSKDVAENKAMGILSYLGFLSLIPYFSVKNSPYVSHHARQGVTLFLFEIVITIVIGALSLIKVDVDGLFGYVQCIPAPVLGIIGILGLVVLVYVIIGICNAITDEAKELPLIGRLHIIK